MMNKTQSQYELFQEWLNDCPVKVLDYQDFTDQFQITFEVELEPPKVTITPQQLEGDISTVTDSDYADKVDTLVGNMVAHDDNNTDKVYPEVDDVPDNIKKEWLYNYTHDSEGC